MKNPQSAVRNLSGTRITVTSGFQISKDLGMNREHV